MEMPPHDPSQGCESWVSLEEHEEHLGSLIANKKYCGMTVPNYPGPSVVTAGSNSLTVHYSISEENLNLGQGFKIKATAVNPLCSPQSYIHQYGDSMCIQSCGDSHLTPGPNVIDPCPNIPTLPPTEPPSHPPSPTLPPVSDTTPGSTTTPCDNSTGTCPTIITTTPGPTTT